MIPKVSLSQWPEPAHIHCKAFEHRPEKQKHSECWGPAMNRPNPMPTIAHDTELRRWLNHWYYRLTGNHVLLPAPEVPEPNRLHWYRERQNCLDVTNGIDVMQ